MLTPDGRTEAGSDLRRYAIHLPVALAPGAEASETIAGELVVPAGAERRPLQVLLHGGTYNRWYWSPAYANGTYSYVEFARRRGLATLAIDRLGQGGSSKPPAGVLTNAVHAFVAHQLVTAARAGVLGGATFDAVVLVGHSMGSGVALSEADRFGDVAGVIVTGYSHRLDVRGGENGDPRAHNYPAAEDPILAAMQLPAGYMTTRAGSRSAAFYSVAHADAGLIAEDEAHKGTLTASELTSFTEVSGLTMSVTAPCLFVHGALDQLFGPFRDAAELVACERCHLPDAASIDGHIFETSHHNTNLHRGAPEDWFGLAMDWVEALA